jgi:hypothetical protein
LFDEEIEKTCRATRKYTMENTGLETLSELAWSKASEAYSTKRAIKKPHKQNGY